MQGGRQRVNFIEDFIENFTGSNQFVLDYLMEEVLHQQHPLAVGRLAPHLNRLFRKHAVGEEHQEQTSWPQHPCDLWENLERSSPCTLPSIKFLPPP